MPHFVCSQRGKLKASSVYRLALDTQSSTFCHDILHDVISGADSCMHRLPTLLFRAYTTPSMQARCTKQGRKAGAVSRMVICTELQAKLAVTTTKLSPVPDRLDRELWAAESLGALLVQLLAQLQVAAERKFPIAEAELPLIHHCRVCSSARHCCN
jgi:hypothetical protein